VNQRLLDRIWLIQIPLNPVGSKLVGLFTRLAMDVLKENKSMVRKSKYEHSGKVIPESHKTLHWMEDSCEKRVSSPISS
jgi:hypothetical protein